MIWVRRLEGIGLFSTSKTLLAGGGRAGGAEPGDYTDSAAMLAADSPT